MPSEEFIAALSAIEDSYKDGLRAFCAWVEANWQMGGVEEWEKAFDDAYPGDAYRDGNNAAIEGLVAALGCFLDEHDL